MNLLRKHFSLPRFLIPFREEDTRNWNTREYFHERSELVALLLFLILSIINSSVAIFTRDTLSIIDTIDPFRDFGKYEILGEER